MENEIKAIIEKNLPEQVGNVLKIRLEKAEKDAVRVEELISNCDAKDKRIMCLENQLQKHRIIDQREVDINVRELKVAEAERSQKVFQAELRAAEAEKRANEIAGFTGMVFRSPVFRKTIDETNTIGSWYSYNEGKQIDVPNRNKVERISEE
jgi:hypothetical protein